MDIKLYWSAPWSAHLKRAFLIAMLAMTVGCASTPNAVGTAKQDPWEKINRPIFEFNDKVDAWVLKPVAQGYQFVTPDPVEHGVSNFFANLAEVPSAFYNMLQWKWSKVGNNTGRFLLNSTIGLAGLIDVAKYTGLERKEAESFGQTLSYWGLGPGPYIVIPFYGPSTVTDIVGKPVDYVTSPLYAVDDQEVALGLWGLRVVDERAALLSAEDIISGDRYTFIRQAYLQRREFLVNDGEVKDDFGGDFDDFEDFEDF